MSDPYTYVCGRCGSEDITKRAFAAWDKDEQEWELVEVDDDNETVHCYNCDAESIMDTRGGATPEITIL